MAQEQLALLGKLPRCLSFTGLLVAALVLAPGPTQAQPPSGGGVVLETHALAGGGEALDSTEPGAQVSAGVTIGQPAVGVMEGDNVKLEIGLWPTIPVPEPSGPVLMLAALAGVALLARTRRRTL